MSRARETCRTVVAGMILSLLAGAGRALPAEESSQWSTAFIENRPKTFPHDNSIIWTDAAQRPDNDIFYRTRRFDFTVKPGTNEFKCVVGGDLSPLCRYVRLVPSGKMVNPWVTTDSSVDTYSPETVVKGLLKPGMSDREKALAVWYFLADKMYWFSNPKEYYPNQTLSSLSDPVVLLNNYGYCCCSLLGPLEVAYWRAAGLEARKVRNGPKGTIFHSMGEVYYDGDWHMMDLTQLVFYLERDDKTIASGQEVCDDTSLCDRMVRKDIGLFDPAWNTREYSQSKWGQMFPGGTTGLPGDHFEGWTVPPARTMDVTLAPHHVFHRSWSNEGFYWNAWDGQKKYGIAEETKARVESLPPCFANGFLRYRLDPKDPLFSRLVEHGASSTPAGQADPPSSAGASRQGTSVILPIDSTSPITDLRVDAVFSRPSDQDQVSVKYDAGDGNGYVPLITLKDTGEAVRASAEAPILKGIYHLKVKFAFESGGDVPPRLVGADVRARFQHNPRSLPSLALGDNVITLRSDSLEGDAALTYVVAERHRLPISVEWPSIREPGLHAGFFSNAGTTSTIPITVTNTGEIAVTLKPTVSANPAGWPLMLSPETVSLEPGQKARLQLRCTPPQESEGQVAAAEIDFRLDGQPAPKRLLLYSVREAVYQEAEAAKTTAFLRPRDPIASASRYLETAGEKASAAYTIRVEKEADYYLVARVNTTKKRFEPFFRFVIDERESREIGYGHNHQTRYRVQLRQHARHWQWRLNFVPVHLAPGTHSVKLMGLRAGAMLDSFALVTNMEMVYQASWNQLFCPAEFDEALVSNTAREDPATAHHVGF